jgi:hypothetical protein
LKLPVIEALVPLVAGARREAEGNGLASGPVARLLGGAGDKGLAEPVFLI